jgi:hypothetical protein
MAKADPRETTSRPGPVRTESGTRVAAARLTPVQLQTGTASPRAANDVNEMPTRELDLEELRAMALRCASDIGPAKAAPTPAADTRLRPRLELVLTDEAPMPAVGADRPGGEVARPRRSGGRALLVLVVMLATASIAALEVYGPWR